MLEICDRINFFIILNSNISGLALSWIRFIIVM